MHGCIDCNKCRETGFCALNDALYVSIREKLPKVDGLIVGSPTYYGGPNGSLCALLDRLFYSSSAFLENKPAASVVICRRGGASATFDRLNKYFLMNNMPLVPSQYWNSVHGLLPGEALHDHEGLQTMRTLANNMAYLLKCTERGKESIPEREPWIMTNYI